MWRATPVFRSILGATALILILGAGKPGVEEQLAQHRNLGKAFYENPTTQAQAVAEFKKALDLAPNSNRERLNYGLALLRAGDMDRGVAELKQVQQRDPTLPYTWFNLGIYYKKAGDNPKAIVQFERLIMLAPEEPIAHYQLGTLYRAEGRIDEARVQLERAAELDPLLAAARFQLYNMYRQLGRQEDAARALEKFQELRKQAEGAAIPEDVEWSRYAEIYDPPISVTAPAKIAAVFDDRVLIGTADPRTAGVTAIDSSGTGDVDLLVWSSRGVALYRKGVDLVSDSGLAGLTGVIFVAPGDFDNDGLMDLCVVTDAGPLLYRNTKGRFIPFPAALPKRRFDRAVWIDYDHDYDLDLILLGDNPALMRNQGSAGFSDRSSDLPFVRGSVTSAFKLRTVPDSKTFDLAVFYRDRDPVLYRDLLGGRYETAPFRLTAPTNDGASVDADFNQDGRMDRVRVAQDGSIHQLTNRTRSSNRWIRVQLDGVKNLKLAEDALVEIKAGSLYQQQWYRGVPLLFDVGSARQIDTVRITWPNGLIQNEVQQATDRNYRYMEAQRLSGSCPMIWTWNGDRFQFITDVLGVAPLGASDGEGTFFPVDHREFIQIPGAALAAVDGHYEIRISEELSEVTYLDQVHLSAIDHPAGTDIFTNSKFKSPPFPEYHLFDVTRRIYPNAARDQGGRDVRTKLLTQDRQYPDQFLRGESGVAELHTLDLDFGADTAPGGTAVLLLNGWVDWADGSTFRAAAQELKTGLVFPYLQMKDASGQWKTVNEDMGMPSGKPKTIVVPLKFISASRELRIVTNLCVYWDEIFLSEGPSDAPVVQRDIPIASADLRFRGFSASVIDPERKQPEAFFYDRVSPTSFWNPTAGLYTRYGDVREPVQDVDDRLVIMGSGDELRLVFRADALPPVAPGSKRDFLLKVDGWAKDRDPNTAFSTTVEPLPFHGMSRYPYAAGEHYPDDPEHQRYRREYNTRPALHLIRPLGAASSGSEARITRASE